MQEGDLMKILIADDDYANQKFMKKLFSYYGEVAVVGDGITAVEVFAQRLKAGEPYGVVCLDVMMTKLDGYKTLEAIREAEQKYGISMRQRAKIVMLSALDEDVRGSLCVCDDYDLYLRKPVAVEEFERQMRKIGLEKQ